MPSASETGIILGWLRGNLYELLHTSRVRDTDYVHYVLPLLSSSCGFWLPGADFRHDRVIWPIRASCPSQVFYPWLLKTCKQVHQRKAKKLRLTAFHEGEELFITPSSVGGRCRMC